MDTFLNIFTSIISRIRDKLSPILLKAKMRSGEIIDLDEWQYLPPHIGRYKIIDCDEKFKQMSQSLALDGKILLSVREMWNIYNWVLKTKDIEGDIAEVGVYKGGSAKLIAEVNGSGKKLHLFDTFEGLPENDMVLNKIKMGTIRGDSLDEVKSYLNKYRNIFYYLGIFPESARDLINKNLKFSFVHLDSDLYEATLDGLRFFYPKLSKNGVIIIHDYRTKHLPGVKKAVDEFIKDKVETIIELWDTQALIMKQ